VDGVREFVRGEEARRVYDGADEDCEEHGQEEEGEDGVAELGGLDFAFVNVVRHFAVLGGGSAAVRGDGAGGRVEGGLGGKHGVGSWGGGRGGEELGCWRRGGGGEREAEAAGGGEGKGCWGGEG